MLRARQAAMKLQLAALETQRKCAREVIDQRDAVMDLQRLMGEAEQRMIRRWGIQTAFNWMVRLAICLAVLLWASYFASGKLAQRQWVASAVVRQLGETIEATPQWTQQQTRLLSSDAAAARASERLRNENLQIAAQPRVIAGLIENGLHVSTPAPNLLHIELQGPRPEMLVPVLDAIVNTYAAPEDQKALHESAAIPERGHVRRHIVQSGQLAEQPVSDNRAFLLVIFFVASATATILLAFSFAAAFVFGRRHHTVAAESTPAAILSDNDKWKDFHDAIDSNQPGRASPLF